MYENLDFNKNEFVLTFPISKVDAKNRVIEGFATLDNVDKAGDILDIKATREAFKSWPGNIREMHDKTKAVGHAIQFVEKKYVGDDNRTYDGMWVRARISKGAEDTWQKVLDGTLTGFSVGGAIYEFEREMIKSGDGSDHPVRRVTKYGLNEISVVDSACNDLAGISLVKFVDGDLVIQDVIDEGELRKADPDGDGDNDSPGGNDPDFDPNQHDGPIAAYPSQHLANAMYDMHQYRKHASKVKRPDKEAMANHVIGAMSAMHASQQADDDGEMAASDELDRKDAEKQAMQEAANKLKTQPNKMKKGADFEAEHIFVDGICVLEVFNKDISSAKAPYGNVQYADPGFQADKKKRYPVDTEEHVKAALGYINQADNAEKYKPEDLVKVRATIYAAAKKIGIATSAQKSIDDMVNDNILQNNEISAIPNVELSEENKGFLKKFIQFLVGAESHKDEEFEKGSDTPDMTENEVKEAITTAVGALKLDELQKSADEKFDQVGDSLTKVAEALEKLATVDGLNELKEDLVKTFDEKVAEVASRVEALESSGASRKSGEDTGEELKKSNDAGFWAGNLVPEYIQNRAKAGV